MTFAKMRLKLTATPIFMEASPTPHQVIMMQLLRVVLLKKQFGIK